MRKCETARSVLIPPHRRHYAIVGAGGVFTAEDAYGKIRLGASLVQILTALVYEGPGVVGSINAGLARLLERDGMRHMSDAVGVDAEHEAEKRRAAAIDPRSAMV